MNDSQIYPKILSLFGELTVTGKEYTAVALLLGLTTSREESLELEAGQIGPAERPPRFTLTPDYDLLKR